MSAIKPRRYAVMLDAFDSDEISFSRFLRANKITMTGEPPHDLTFQCARIAPLVALIERFYDTGHCSDFFPLIRSITIIGGQ